MKKWWFPSDQLSVNLGTVYLFVTLSPESEQKTNRYPIASINHRMGWSARATLTHTKDYLTNK